MKILLAVPVAVLLFNVAAPAAPPLTAGAPVPLAGTSGGFDFLEMDAGKGRLLLDHTGNGTLDILDTATGKLLKSVPTGAAQGVAVDEAGGHYLVSVSKEKKLVIVDREKLTVTGEVKLGGPGDAITFNPKNGLAYVGHDDAGEVWALDPKIKSLTATIPIAEGPEYAVTDPAANLIYQNIKSNGTVAVINGATNQVTATWGTKPAARPHGLAMEAATHRLFCAGANGMLVVLDTTTGKVTGELTIAAGVDQMAFDPEWRRLYAASGSGVISVIQVTDAGVSSLGEVKSAKGAKTVAVDPKTHTVWTAYAEGKNAFVLAFKAMK